MKALFELSVQSPGFRSIKEDGLYTGLEEFDFQMFRDSRGPDLLEFYTRSPSHTFSDVEVLPAICNIGS